ncbi:YggT family protein [Treponema pedis]|uniref:YggT family protein n=1 Tax=Treponema pedis str. T A4 TaxID=1291379 RepID=S6A3A3_9SPIR|nr:YggT family protein [Treponema pedis]AGT43381.1 hypothetical protein TPE_0885 [Treponema pedis str. T A4]QSI04195.1 YggT family protein [Treponema pedis]
MLSSILYTCGIAVKIYSYLCIAYIFLSWLGGNSSGGFLSELCEPYLSKFRRFRFTQIGSVDFSPVLGLGILSLISHIFFQLSATKTISVAAILLSLVGILWSFFSFLLNFFIILLIIRLILDCIPEYRSGNLTNMLDRFLAPVFIKVYELSGRKFMTVRKQIVICLIAVTVTRILLGMFVGSAMTLFNSIKII